MRVALPAALREQILAAARDTHPNECCGLVLGFRDEEQMRIMALHAARNLSGDPQRFLIDPADHVAAQKAARLCGWALIGCYHSHPHGRAEPSAVDLASANEDGLLWLIAAGKDLRAFVYLSGVFEGADWVTSSV